MLKSQGQTALTGQTTTPWLREGAQPQKNCTIIRPDMQDTERAQLQQGLQETDTSTADNEIAVLPTSHRITAKLTIPHHKSHITRRPYSLAIHKLLMTAAYVRYCCLNSPGKLFLQLIPPFPPVVLYISCCCRSPVEGRPPYPIVERLPQHFHSTDNLLLRCLQHF